MRDRYTPLCHNGYYWHRLTRREFDTIAEAEKVGRSLLPDAQFEMFVVHTAYTEVFIEFAEPTKKVGNT